LNRLWVFDSTALRHTENMFWRTHIKVEGHSQGCLSGNIHTHACTFKSTLYML